MAFLGRPSGGDSPFAIGDRALRDQTSPQPPQQRNPTPRKSNNPQRASFENNMAPAGVMATPSPYGSVSDEARRRYEERYAKKKAEEAAKAEAEAREAEEKERQAQAAAQRQPPQGFSAPPQQQYFDPPPRQGSGYSQHVSPNQRPPSLQPNPGPYSPNPQPQRWSNPGPLGGLSPQPQQSGFGGSQGHSSQGHGSRPASHQGHQGQFGGSQGQGYAAQPVQSPGPGGMQWSQNAPPPPSQQWSRSQSPPQNQPPAQQWQQQQSPPPPPPPVQAPRAEDAELRNLFSQFDSSRSGSLNSYDLERLLAKDATMEAREDCVKMLMNIFDTDRSGSINFQEFEGLYRYIQDWHGIFLRFDRDGSGLIDRKELHQALLGFGFSLPLDMVRKLEKRFAPPPKPGHPPRKGISFDRFLMACVSVKHYTEAFRRTDVSGSGRITLDYNQYMDIILDSPS